MATQNYAHNYLADDGQPLRRCPECGHDLTIPGRGVVIQFVAGRNSAGQWETNGSLRNGKLTDPTGDVAKGYHAGTACVGCRALLDDYEDDASDGDAE